MIAPGSYRGVTKSFGELEVLKHHLTVAEHEAVALIAPPVRKSTLLPARSALEISDGDIYLDGEVITDPSSTPSLCAARSGSSSSLQPFSAHAVLDDVTLGVAGPGLGTSEAEDAPARSRPFGPSGRERNDPPTPAPQQRVAIAVLRHAAPRDAA